MSLGVGYTGHFLMKLFRLLTLIFFPVQYDKTNTKVKKVLKKIDLKIVSARFSVFGSKNEKSTKNSNKMWCMKLYEAVKKV